MTPSRRRQIAQLNGAALFALMAIAGCDERTLSPVSAGPGCPAPPLEPIPPAALVVDDLEDGDLGINRVAGLDGLWTFWDDDTNDAGLSFEVSARCAASGRLSMHARSTGQRGWGASMNVFLRKVPPNTPWDGRAYSAVSFYLATGLEEPTLAPPPDTGVPAMKAGLTTLEVAWDGPCDPCMDTWGMRITPSPRWQRFVLPFESLKQDGWGRPGGLTFRTDQLVQLNLPLSGAFDVWVDRIAFEK